MARPSKQVIEYFSHDCQHTKSLEIVEGRFGIVGYGVWFKLLEALGTAEGHFLDFSDEMVFEHFSGAKCRVSGAETELILNLFSRLGAIDRELWKNKVVWCQHFVDRLAEVYKKRKCSLPLKPPNRNGNGVSDTGNEVSAPCSPGNDTKESRVKKSKEKNIYTPPKGEFKNVLLTEEENQKLIEKFGQELANQKIENLSEGIASKGYKYKSHYATILTWSKKDGISGDNQRRSSPFMDALRKNNNI